MNSVGILSFQMGKTNTSSLASASIIEYKGNIFIATAAHCLYDVRSNEIAKNITIKIQNESFNVTNIVIPERWIDTHMLTYDYAFGRVEIDNSKKDIAFTPVFDLSNSVEDCSKVITLAGYRFSLFKSKKKYSRGNLDLTLFKTEQLIGMKSKLKEGISGGPWFFETGNKRFQIGVTSARIKSFKSMVWASIWTEETEKVLNKLLTDGKQEKIIIT